MSELAKDQIAAMRGRLSSIDVLLNEAEERLERLLAGEGAGAPAVAAAAKTAAAPPIFPGAPTPAAPVGAPAWKERPSKPDVVERILALGGPKLLAVAGGIAVIAGLVFLYVLASQRGILGPTGRVLIGAGASGLLIGVGAWLQTARKDLYAALTAVGVGIAGLYVAIVTASQRYDLIAPEVGIALAGAVAALAVFLAMRWDNELIAAFGVVGALIAPPTLDAGLSSAGVGFAIILAAAVLVVWLRQGWDRLAIAGLVLSAGYLAALIFPAALADERSFGWNPYWQAVAGATAYWALLAGAWLARFAMGRRDSLNLRILLAAGTVSVVAARLMFEGRAAGIALVVVAIVNLGLVAAPRLLGQRDSALETASGLVAAAALTLAMLELLGGASLVVGLALQGVILAILAVRQRSAPLEIGAMVHVGLAIAGTVGETARLDSLFEYPPVALLGSAGDALAIGPTVGAIVSALAIALATAIVTVAHFRRAEQPQPVLAALAVATALFATATLVVDGALLIDLSRGTFQTAHVVVSVLWAVVALVVLYVGLRKDMQPVRLAGLALLGVTVAKLVLYDLGQLTALARVSSFIVVGVLLLVGSIFYQRLASEITDSAKDGTD